MDGFVTHLADGSAFFAGVGLASVAVVLGLSTRPRARRFARLACLVGLILVAVSGTPLPTWYYALMAVSAIVWLVLFHRVVQRQRAWLVGCAFALVWLIGVGMELPYHVLPQLSPVAGRSLSIFGDSVTAGIGENEAQRWPALLERTHTLDVHDFSAMGETAASAFKRSQTVEVPAGIVIIEIGGNDLLGETTVKDFDDRLDALLERLAVPERQLVMFELPLPPFYNWYGRSSTEVGEKARCAAGSQTNFHANSFREQLHLGFDPSLTGGASANGDPRLEHYQSGICNQSVGSSQRSEALRLWDESSRKEPSSRSWTKALGNCRLSCCQGGVISTAQPEKP